MWENEKRKKIIVNLVIFLVLVLVSLGLLKTMISVKEKIDQEDMQLSAEHSNQRQEQSVARQENVEAVQQVYQKDLETIASYLPGIVCWGDSLTAGSSGNVSYPATLQKYINTYLCDIYDIRYSLENAESFSRLNADDYRVSIPVVNMGAGQEDSATILGRCGTVPYVVKSDFVIPAGKSSVTIELMSQDGKAVMPLTAGGAGVNPVTIAGIEGTLSLVTSNVGWTQTFYQFTRLEEGAETPVSRGTQIVTAATEEYKDYIHIVWMGTYGEYTNPEKLVSEVKTLLQRQTINNDRYLVIGPCTYRGSWTSSASMSLESLDSAMMQAFGDRYISARKYLIEDGMRDAGISATRTDSDNIKMGLVPTSFRSPAAGADLNSLAYKLIAKVVFDRMEKLGYFDEVRLELNLDKITQELLKNDVNYFEKQLKVN